MDDVVLTVQCISSQCLPWQAELVEMHFEFKAFCLLVFLNAFFAHALFVALFYAFVVVVA